MFSYYAANAYRQLLSSCTQLFYGRYTVEDFVEAKFYCLHFLADINKHI